ncbi:uncharacterized protein LOC123300864 [Chrysoperla carnea]|uniref:uncharacterized protein LOC123300864 n=1 Tax=Chrysoperla carnea TaxID=189513 RepID=UPI001D06CC85|nr:uncharacterized protein LOC123300864 [Chrysoperla carnea]
MPFFYLLWQMSRLTKERLCGYFRFSKRKLEQSTTDIVTTYTSVSSTTGGGIVLGVVTNNLISVGIHRNNNSIQIRNSTHEATIANGTIIEHQVTDNNDIDTECITTMNTKELNTTSISPTFITLPLTTDNNDAENLGDFDRNVSLSNNRHAPLQRQKYNRNRSRRSSKHNNQLLENGMPKEICYS